jgi:predicted SprT family Zn-dependent metalloprotease
MTIRPAAVKVTCACGKVHSFERARVLERLGKARYKCAGCKRRFIVACTPVYAHHPETFWAIYLEDVPSLGDTQDIGIHADGGEEELPERLQFTCRCGCRLVGERKMYGRRTHCPKCQVRIILRVGYHTATGKPVALLEYVEGSGKTGIRPAVRRSR